MTDMEAVLKSLFKEATGEEAINVTPLPGAGSNRRYFRISGESATLVGTCGDDIRENEAFVYLSNMLSGMHANVPRVLAVADGSQAYVQDDLGTESLFDAVMADMEAARPMLERTMEQLAYIHYKASRNIDYSRCYPRRSFDRRSVMWDLNYFKYDFLKATGLEFSEDELEDDFCRLADMLLSDAGGCDAFMLRDCQARNVMIHDGRPYFIDFQSGRRGPGIYDVVSFVGQARAGYPVELRNHLIDCYLEAAARYTEIDEARFRSRLPIFFLFRTLQVLGCYGFRGYFERKTLFLASIPPAIDNLKRILAEGVDGLDYLVKVLKSVCAMPQFARCDEASEGLTVNVGSFSYRKGIPADYSGNGGGFVFDCRSVHNPGRYDRYKPLTGLDTEVIEFLEAGGEMTAMMESAYSLVDAAVEKYLSRGFTHLQVSFGCTGGRHRSVYGAQHMAEHLNWKYGVRVHLEHREQGIIKDFPAK